MFINVNCGTLINMDAVLTMEIVATKKEVALKFLMSNPTDKHEVQVTYDTMKKAREAYERIMSGISRRWEIVDI